MFLITSRTLLASLVYIGKTEINFVYISVHEYVAHDPLEFAEFSMSSGSICLLGSCVSLFTLSHIALRHNPNVPFTISGSVTTQMILKKKKLTSCMKI